MGLRHSVQAVQAAQPRIQYANQIVWLDNLISAEQIKNVQKHFKVRKISTVEEFFSYVNKQWIIGDIKLVCGANLFTVLQQRLRQQREIEDKIVSIFIYYSKKEKQEQFKHINKVICVSNSLSDLIKVVRNHLMQRTLPNLRIFQDNEEKTIQLKYQYFLAYLTYPIEELQRKQLVKEFITTLNQQKHEHSLINNYPDQNNLSQILKLYEVVWFFVNRYLQSNSLKIIDKAHIFIHDLNLAIKKLSSFEFRSKIPSVLFRGTQFSETEVNKLKTNIGSTIELLGFLPTSKNEEVAKNQLFMKNALIKIYIPSFFREERSNNMKMRQDYIDLASHVQTRYENEQQVLFNIKSVFTVLRVLSKREEVKKMFTIEMLYGKMHLLLYLSENKKRFSFQLFENQENTLQKYCKNCNSTVHLIGTSSKHRFCLKDFPPLALQKESFILENANKTVTGMPLEYDELTLKHFGNPEGESESLLCKKCQSKVRCSGCLKEFCLCALESHDKEHLDKCYIMVEGELPRFLILELNKEDLSLFQNYQELQSQITCRADAFRLMKEEHAYKEAWSLYSQKIGKSYFQSLDYKTQYHYYENRAQSCRLRKYLRQEVRTTITIQGLQRCIQDYKKCFQLVKDKQNEALRQSKATMYIGIIQDDIAQMLQKKELSQNYPLLQSNKLFKDALQNYESASKILTLVKKQRELRKEEMLQYIAIKNCAAFIYWHWQQFQTAINMFEDVLSLTQTLKEPIKREEAKYLNNLTCCINQYVEKLNWSDLPLIKKYLEKAVVYGNRSYDLRMCLFGAGYSLTYASKFSFKKAKEHLGECQLKLRQEEQKNRI